MPTLIPELASLLPDNLRILIQQAGLPDLQGTLAQPSLKDGIEAWERSLSSQQPKLQFHGELKDLILAALWLLEGDLDQSHRYSQKWENSNGNYWHAIMHRREGDYGNAKYWYRRVEKHPVAEQLRERLREQKELADALGELNLSSKNKSSSSGAWLASWVDLNQKAIEERLPHQKKIAVSELAWLEWQLLLAHCLTDMR
jgi:hypothetical protein